MTGTLFDIQHFCTGDGPGIRTTVFLKGCTLRCAWCHNPESQSFRPEVLLNPVRCIGCGTCDSVCPSADAKGVLASAKQRQALCAPTSCTACTAMCPTGCLELAGKEYTVQAVLDEVMQDEPYYRHSGGGITLSGGEPLAQTAFSRALLQEAAARGLHTAVESSGNGNKADFLALAPFVRLWLWDVKLMDADLYRDYAGGSLERMLNNLDAVAATGAELHFRILYLPELHEREGVAEATAALLRRYPHKGAEVIPYHLLGNAKREKIGLPEKRFREPETSETMSFARRIGLR